jgi:3-keto-5-aminohexanoate cleavage enzyme
MEKLVISAAVTGSLTTRDQNPNIPYTPQEIAHAAIDSCRAGASVVHLHVREPETGRPVQDIDLFKETIGLIRQECDILVNTSTGGGPGMTYDERIAIVPALSADSQLKPDLASLNAGSVNFGIINRKDQTLALDAVQTNPWSELMRFAKTMTAQGVKPEIEIYEAGMINNAKVLFEFDLLKAPLHFQFVLGVMGGLQPTVENLVFLKNAIPDGSTWSLCSVGLSIFSLGAAAIAAGGHIRVGFEDCVYIKKGEMAASNAQMVEKVVRMAKEMGREIATPADTKRILSLSE